MEVFENDDPLKNSNSLFVCFCAQNNTLGKRITQIRRLLWPEQNYFYVKTRQHLPVLISYRWTQSRHLIITTYSIQSSQPLSVRQHFLVLLTNSFFHLLDAPVSKLSIFGFWRLQEKQHQQQRGSTNYRYQLVKWALSSKVYLSPAIWSVPM